MLYDEEGRPYVEPPILPEDFNTFWIVADYRRMYGLHWKMQRKIKRLGEKNCQMANYNFFMRHKLQELLAVTKKLAKRINDIDKEDLLAIYDADCVAYPGKKRGKQKNDGQEKER